MTCASEGGEGRALEAGRHADRRRSPRGRRRAASTRGEHGQRDGGESRHGARGDDDRPPVQTIRDVAAIQRQCPAPGPSTNPSQPSASGSCVRSYTWNATTVVSALNASPAMPTAAVSARNSRSRSSAPAPRGGAASSVVIAPIIAAPGRHPPDGASTERWMPSSTASGVSFEPAGRCARPGWCASLHP